jgi:hypothetical protein
MQDSGAQGSAIQHDHERKHLYGKKDHCWDVSRIHKCMAELPGADKVDSGYEQCPAAMLEMTKSDSVESHHANPENNVCSSVPKDKKMPCILQLK